METKKQIRKQIFAARKNCTDEQVEKWSRAITERVLLLPAFQNAQRILAYADYNHEVMTRYIIEEAWKVGKEVAVPKVDGKDMIFYKLEDFSQLEAGYFGIPEPSKGEIVQWQDALIIMPGVAFDRENHRVGYGGGFYDRFLEKHSKIQRVAVAFDFQMLEKVPTEDTDICPQIIVTEKETCYLKDGRQLLVKIGMNAKEAEQKISKLSTNKKNEVLRAVADKLIASTESLLKANAVDIAMGKANGMNPGLLDRLLLTEERIKAMAVGLYQLCDLEDPIGEVIGMKKRPNGLLIGQKRVPLGVIGIIYEARPNVTADAFGLCFKTGNVVILKGGSDAIHSNTAIVACIREALTQCQVDPNAVQLITDTSRETAAAFMRMNEYVDVLIPRGGKGLIHAVVQNSTIPVIETGTGNCHIYVDESADLEMAADIVMNAKTQRVGVCNACESLLVHEKVKDAFLPVIAKRLQEKQVEIRADEAASALIQGCVPAQEEDWGREYLDYILSVKVVDSIEEAITHINRYNTKHSEAIITKDYANAQKFLDEVDAAAVYVNASTRFTDGFEFGYGAEIGISTQKLHARGPMGLLALTTTKYVIYGNGQIRP